MPSLQQLTDVSHASDTVLPEAELVARAGALVSLLRTNAERTERDRRVAPENLEGLRGAGLLRLTTPSAYGGVGASIRTQVEVGLALGRGCPSTAWVAGIFNGVRPMTLMLSDAAREEFYQEGPDSVACSVASVHGEAVRTEGGLRLSGTWAAASGCEDAHWALLGVPLPGIAGAPPSGATVLVPLQDLEVKDTWHVAGMRGTGSQSLVADAVLIPDHRVIGAAVAPSGGSGGGFPAALKIGATLNLLAPVVGAALGGLDIVREVLDSGKGIIASVYRDTKASPSAQMWLGEADHLTSRAARLIASVADAADASMVGDPLSLQERSALRMDMVASTEYARAAMSRLLDLTGSSAFSDAHPLQRYWRDMETGARHVQFNPFITREDYGRVAVGIGSPVSLLV
ncbi:acyl-CoA dehydrogenase family protein [Streptomyces sp. NPDC006551]|uniref:acyl-CoA dehydrogenase family protein n=1 Tax=Streptomyces sp. NPDC006551 TaxID=3157178 RepID=UPI0033B20160